MAKSVPNAIYGELLDRLGNVVFVFLVQGSAWCLRDVLMNEGRVILNVG